MKKIKEYETAVLLIAQQAQTVLLRPKMVRCVWFRKLSMKRDSLGRTLMMNLAKKGLTQV